MKSQIIEKKNEYIVNPKGKKKNISYIVFLCIFWIIWAPVTALFSYLAVTQMHPFFFIWLIFGFWGTFGIPYFLTQLNRRQKIIIEKGRVYFIGTRFLANSSISTSPYMIKELSLDFYDEESIPTLNIITSGKPKRIMLANFVSYDAKRIIFDEIKTFFNEHGIICACNNNSK